MFDFSPTMLLQIKSCFFRLFSKGYHEKAVAINSNYLGMVSYDYEVIERESNQSQTKNRGEIMEGNDNTVDLSSYFINLSSLKAQAKKEGKNIEDITLELLSDEESEALLNPIMEKLNNDLFPGT